ncbi:MAG: hypothetical protein ACI39Q_05465 [Wujia sp.]
MNKKIVIIPILYSLLFFVTYLLSEKAVSASQLIIWLSFGCISNHKAFLSEAFFQFLFVMFAYTVFGNRIYKNFCNASAYFYVRTTSIRRWYLQETIAMLIDIVEYYSITLVTLMCLCFCSGKMNKIESCDLLFIIYFVTIFSIHTLGAGIAINVLSMYVNSGMALGIVAGINVFFMGCYLITGDIFSEEYLSNNSLIFKINPICHLMIGIHESKCGIMSEYLNRSLLQASLSDSIIYLSIFTISFIILGYILIDKIDILGEKEEGA